MCNQTYRQIYAEGADCLVPGMYFEDVVRHVCANGGGSADSPGREADWLAERIRHHLEDGDHELRLKSGSWILATDRRMNNGGIAGLRINITALKQAQASLRESEARLDRAQEIAGIGSWELDLATRRSVWSKELYRIRGLLPDEFESNFDNVEAYVHPDDFAEVRRWLGDLASGVEQSTHDTRIIRPDGKTRALRVEGQAVRDPDGVVRRLAGTMQDITERGLIE